MRLKGLWLEAALVPAVLIFGFTMEYETHWAGSLVNLFIEIFGIQVMATMCLTHSIDSHRVEGSEIFQFINFCCQTASFPVAFYAVDLCEAIGFQLDFLAFALVGTILDLPSIVWLLWKGGSIRERLGRPVNVSVAQEIGFDYDLANCNRAHE